MKKKILMLLVVGLMTTSLCACGEKPAKNSDNLTDSQSGFSAENQVKESAPPQSTEQLDSSEAKNDASVSVQTKDSNSAHSTTSSASSSANGISADFKAAMDSYEAFFDEYVAFMEKYKNSGDVTSMLSDYSKYMNQYTETMKKMSDLKTDKLSAAELAYYSEVTARITQKLAQVAQ